MRGPLDAKLIAPMLATPASLDQIGDGFTHEFKWDGIRAQVHVWPGNIRIFTRTGREVSSAFPEIMPLKESVGRSCVLDGEIVALDAGGRPDFGRLQHRIGLQDRPAIR